MALPAPFRFVPFPCTHGFVSFSALDATRPPMGKGRGASLAVRLHITSTRPVETSLHRSLPAARFEITEDRPGR
jgi:hypothetical protein